jgi:hypothetical protein
VTAVIFFINSFTPSINIKIYVFPSYLKEILMDKAELANSCAQLTPHYIDIKSQLHALDP